MVGKPLGFRGLGLPPSYAATNGRICIPARSTPAHAEASAHAGRLSTPPFSGVWGIGTRLKSRPF
jgi:hypothetical protein